jgi:ribosome maturation factor RimP
MRTPTISWRGSYPKLERRLSGRYTTFSSSGRNNRVGFDPLFFLGVAHSVAGAVDAVRAVAERVTSALGYELVDVEMARAKGGHLVRLYVDKPGGIGLDELKSVSDEVSAILDVEDPIASSYILEVSSPGLDRPLKTFADYERFVGRLAKLSSYELVDGRRHWTGRLEAAAEGIVSIRLEKEGGALARIPFEKLAHGRLEVEFR